MSVPDTLTTENAVLVLIDYQERLFPAMHDPDRLLKNVLKLVRGASVLGLPVVLTEQYPQGLGPTLPEIRELLPGAAPLAKTCFSACDDEAFLQALRRDAGRTQVLLAGIETHICVYQTALALVRDGYRVQVVTDACSSRDPANETAALRRMEAAGAGPTNVEMALFELLKVARGEVFKQISRIVK
jgi:nicotinamidase-related amidase